jgi:uncharacterized membrane protein YsdA (DUF1294 family)
MEFATLALIYIMVMNILAFWSFLRDKRAAIAGTRRIPEDRLLAMAFLGGSLGAKLAQQMLRHKIRTEPFRQQLNGIIAVQILAASAIWVIRLLAGP